MEAEHAEPHVHPLFAQVVRDYAELEPAESDTWTPLADDVELHHRAELLKHLTWAVRAAGVDVSTTRVLDVGCGNGRSTRMYVDLGWRPEMLAGLDLRPGAVAHARSRHPTISYDRYDGATIPVRNRGVGWASLCTVLSSVREPDARRHLIARIGESLAPGGFVFFWDLLRANPFAGGDPLDPAALFAPLTVVWRQTCTIEGFFVREGHRESTRTPTHQAVLLQR